MLEAPCSTFNSFENLGDCFDFDGTNVAKQYSLLQLKCRHQHTFCILAFVMFVLCVFLLDFCDFECPGTPF